MKSLEKIKSMWNELLAHGVELDAGKQKFLLATPEGLAKVRAGTKTPLVLKVVRVGTPRAESKSRKRTAATLKVEPGRILTELENAGAGLRMRDVAARLDVPWQGLIASLRFLKRRRKVTEANGFYFLAGTSRPAAVERPRAERSTRAERRAAAAAAAARRAEKSCQYEDCDKPHYAKGLCNNHYNIERRRAASNNEFDPEQDVQKRKAYRLTILSALREQKSGITLFNLGKVINEKWQTLRQPANELVRERLVSKRGKLYVPVAGVDVDADEDNELSAD